MSSYMQPEPPNVSGVKTFSAPIRKVRVILDAIRELDMAPVDTARPVDVVRATVQKFALETDQLILMARKYYGQKTLVRTIDIMLEGSYESARG